MTAPAAIRFRDALAADLPSLVALDAVCFAPETRYSLDLMRFFALHCSSKAVAGVDDRDQIIAFIIVHLLRTGLGEVVTIDVDPAARGQGIAKTLMARGEQWLKDRGARGIFLEVDEDNDSAVALYEKFGYEVRHPFIEEGKRRLLMEKTLQ